MTLDPDFRRRIVGASGARGETWLTALPSLVKACAERWSLGEIRVFDELSYAWVARALGPDGPVVLKLSVPGTESRTEPEALARFPSGVACDLYAADTSVCAILLEDLRPGRTLWTVADFDARLRIASGVLARLHARDLAPATAAGAVRSDLSRFPDYAAIAGRALTGACESLPGLTTGGRERRPLRRGDDARLSLRRAAERALELLRDGDGDDLFSPRVLVHGDLHHGNILASGDAWRVIDPKGIAAPLWMEPARYIINQYDDAAEYERQAQFDRMVETFADALRVPVRLVARGAVLDAAVSAVWSWEDGEDDEAIAIAAARAEQVERLARR